MSKYENSNNNNFSDTKYFQSGNDTKTNVIKKHLNHTLISNTPKYTNTSFVQTPINKSLKQKQYSRQKLTSETSAEKYKVVDDSIIQKRYTNFEKTGGGWWDKIKDAFGSNTKQLEADAAAYRALEAERARNRVSGTAAGVSSAPASVSSTPPYVSIERTSPSAKQRIDAGYEALHRTLSSMGPIESIARGVDATLASRLARKRVWGKNAKSIEDWEDNVIFPSYGGYDESVHPLQTPSMLARTNPKAHNYLMDKRTNQGIDLALPVTFEEATELVPLFATTLMKPSKTGKKDYIASNLTSPKTSTQTMGSPETTYGSSSGGLTTAEKAFVDEWTTHDVNDVGLPYTYLEARGIDRNSKEGKKILNDFKYDSDKKQADFLTYLESLTTKQKLAKPDEASGTSSGIASGTSVPYSTDVAPIDGKRRRREGYRTEEWTDYKGPGVANPSTYDIVPFGGSKSAPSTPTGVKPAFEYDDVSGNSIWFGPPRKHEIVPYENKSAIVPAKDAIPVINVYEGNWTDPRYKGPKKQKTPSQPKTPKKPLTTKQRLALAAAAAIAGKIAYDQATTPYTYIPKNIEPTGEFRMYGQSGGPDLGEKYKLPKAKPGFPSYDYSRLLISGSDKTKGTYQLDENGNYMYVRSQIPIPPNVNPFDAQGNKKKYTNPRMKEEMWRFGSDLYDEDKSNLKSPNKQWWSKKWEFRPDD
jgi:hypothetical protein